MTNTLTDKCVKLKGSIPLVDIIKRTKGFIAGSQQQSARDLAEEALDVAIATMPLEKYRTLKALRLTCKRTKVAADARVREFTMNIGLEPEAVERSGLLETIKKLYISFDLRTINDEPQQAEHLSRAVGLLNLAVDVCSKFLEVLSIYISGSPEIALACHRILGNSDWNSLQELSRYHIRPLPGFLCSILKSPGSLPALRKLYWRNPNADDIEALGSSKFVGNLTDLSIYWAPSAHESNMAPATIVAMRNLLQKASSLENLDLTSGTCEYFDCEQLKSLKTLVVSDPIDFEMRHVGEDTVDPTPVLARPWKTLESLEIGSATLKEPDVVRIFEAEDTLPALKKLTISGCSFNVDALSCVRRPHLESLAVDRCINGHELISKLTQLRKEDKCTLDLREFYVDFGQEDPLSSAIEALSEFLSCPSMASLETLSIQSAEIGTKDTSLLGTIANYCPKLTFLDLKFNELERPSLALLLGYGKYMGAWPELKKLTGFSKYDHEMNYDDPDNIHGIHPYMKKLNLEKTLRRIWPGLECN